MREVLVQALLDLGRADRARDHEIHLLAKKFQSRRVNAAGCIRHHRLQQDLGSPAIIRKFRWLRQS
jgi:hypothetical protein